MVPRGRFALPFPGPKPDVIVSYTIGVYEPIGIRTRILRLKASCSDRLYYRLLARPERLELPLFMLTARL